MKKFTYALIVTMMSMVVAVGCTTQEKKKEVKLESFEDKVSYSIGMNLGTDFKRQEIEVDPKILAQAIADVMGDKEALMTQEEAQETLMSFQQKLMEKREVAMKEMTEKNKIEGEAFLAENGKKEGVVTLESGLQYKVIEEGEGSSPTAEDVVTVNYRGTLVDGTEFDSSFKRGQPATFPVSGVIPGWTEALQLMKEGAKWELFIPASLAYGERGAGAQIGPNATLVFEVELISIQR